MVIPAGQHLVLDYSPPRMYMTIALQPQLQPCPLPLPLIPPSSLPLPLPRYMIIVFGSLTFARADLHLKASYIVT